MESPHDVALVITREPRPARRSGAIQPTPVSEEATRHALSLLETSTVTSGMGFQAIRDAKPDALIVIAYGEILPREVLDLAPRGALNVHFSLLPELRGASPVQSAILEGADLTGVSVIELDEGMDTGPILAQERERMSDADNAEALGERLAARGAGLLVNVLDDLERGTAHPNRQDDSKATYARKLTAADRQLDWTQSADALARRVRAFAPTPGASTTFGDRVLKILAARVGSPEGSPEGGHAAAESGEVLSAAADGLVVATGEGALTVVTVAPAGRNRMSAADFVRGTKIGPGDRLG